MLQAPIFDRLSFDPFAFLDGGLCSAEVGVGRRDVVQALMIALMVVMLDERFDLSFEIARQEVVFQQDAVLECLVPALILPCVCGCIGAPRTWLILLASMYSASSPAI